MSVRLGSASKKANDVDDAKGDPQLEAILQTPLVPSDERQVMCPHLYRAIHGGNIDRVNELLGFTMQIANRNNESQDVKVEVDDTHNSKSQKGRIHGNDLCTLGEVTAEKNTVLHIASKQNHLELAQKFIMTDKNLLRSQNSRGETPLHLAARYGNNHIISLIVTLAQESGIEVVMMTSTSGDTALHEAARHGHEDAVRELMKEAQELSAVTNNANISPLYLAVVRNSLAVVEALLEYSESEPSASGPNKQNALHAAVLGSQSKKYYLYTV